MKPKLHMVPDAETQEHIRQAEFLMRSDLEGPVVAYEHVRARRPIEAVEVERELRRFVAEHGHLAGNRAGTIEYNQKQVPVLVRFAREFGLARIQDFTADIAPVFAAWLASQKISKGRKKGQFWSARYRNMLLKFAKMAWKHFLSEGRATESPFAAIKDRKVDPDSRPICLTDGAFPPSTSVEGLRGEPSFDLEDVCEDFVAERLEEADLSAEQRLTVPLLVVADVLVGQLTTAETAVPPRYLPTAYQRRSYWSMFSCLDGSTLSPVSGFTWPCT